MCQLLFTVGLLTTCLRWTSAAAVPEGTVYGEVDGTAVLHPGSAVTGNIERMIWKYGADKATEWSGGKIIFYQQFKDRCELNTRTGELTIKHLTLSDGGFYSVEINGYEVNTVQLWVMTPVHKPSVSTWCDPAKTYCLLTCEGTSSVPESLKYRWKEENDWSHSMKVLNITKENKEPEFSCEIKNPVSSSRSDPVQNPFITGNLLWIIAVVLVILLIVIVAVVLYYKRKNIYRKGKKTAAGEADAEKSEEIKFVQDDQRVQPATNGPGVAGDEGEPGETTELLSQSGGVQQVSRGDVNNRPDVSSPAATSSGSSADIHHESAQSPGAAGSSASNTDSEGTVYVEVDGTTVLHPGSADTGEIMTVKWKHNGSTVAEWYGTNVSFSQQFKGRCELNTMTGELTINHLTLSHSGFYSAEINGKETNTVQLQVMSEERRKQETEKPSERSETPDQNLTRVLEINMDTTEGTVYEEVDGTAVLHPGSAVTGDITAIRWKHNGDLLTEWYGGNIFSPQQFRGRCELNIMTGELTINHLTLSDSGRYSAEINDKETNTVQLRVMYGASEV